MTHALIIGGGIAGTTTAMALHKAGITATVHEARPSGGDDIGAFLLVMHNGMDALRAIDAQDPVIAASFRTTLSDYVDAQGTTFASGPMGPDYQDPDGPRTLRRADLYRALQDEWQRRGGRIEYGKKLVDASTTSGGQVVVTFADGTQAEGDLLIGADGTYSATRKFIAPATRATEFGGRNLIFGYTRETTFPIFYDTFRVLRGNRNGLAYITSPDNETFWASSLPGEPLDKTNITTVEQWRRQLAETFSDDPDDTALRIVSATNDILATSILRLPAPLAKWYNSTTVLVGDAAHTTGPAAGQGASIALEDGVMLAKCLRDLPDLELAFAAFQRLRQERIKQLLAFNSTPVRTLDEAKDNARTEHRDFLYAHKIDWDEPITVDHSAPDR